MDITDLIFFLMSAGVLYIVFSNAKNGRSNPIQSILLAGFFGMILMGTIARFFHFVLDVEITYSIAKIGTAAIVLLDGILLAMGGNFKRNVSQ